MGLSLRSGMLDRYSHLSPNPTLTLARTILVRADRKRPGNQGFMSPEGSNIAQNTTYMD